MNYIKQITVIILLALNSFSVVAQDFIQEQLPKEVRYAPIEVLDQEKGIVVYEALNQRLGGDSVRKCKGYGCQGWKRDVYVSGKILHKGYYVDGQLKTYKNYYPNGSLEREFRVIDDFRSNMRLFHSIGSQRQDIKYQGRDIIEKQDFSENGDVKYHERFNTKIEYFIFQKKYNNAGKLVFSRQLTDKKKLEYYTENYYDSGIKKSAGKEQFNGDTKTYDKLGKWKEYDEKGKEIK